MTERIPGLGPNDTFQKYNPHHDGRGRFASSGGSGGGGSGGGGGYATAMNSAVSSIASNHFFVSNLNVQNSDRLDFHEVGVIGVKRALSDAYLAGQKAALQHAPSAKGIKVKTKQIDQNFAEDLAVTHFGRPREAPLNERKHDSLDFTETSVTGIKDGLRAAFDAGYLHVQRSTAKPSARIRSKAQAPKPKKVWISGQLRNDPTQR